MSSSKGQTMIELIIVMAVVVIVVGALVFATIASLRNAQFAKNQAQATKLAQEGLEKIRALRDRDGAVDYILVGNLRTSKFSDLWSITFSCPDNNCYFRFNSAGVLTGVTSVDFEPVSADFKRQFQIEEDADPDPSRRKKITTIVVWTDFAGKHESRLTTILTKP